MRLRSTRPPTGSTCGKAGAALDVGDRLWGIAAGLAAAAVKPRESRARRGRCAWSAWAAGVACGATGAGSGTGTVARTAFVAAEIELTTGSITSAGADGTDSGARGVDSGGVAAGGVAGAAAEEAASAWSTAGWTAATAAGATWFTCASALCT